MKKKKKNIIFQRIWEQNQKGEYAEPCPDSRGHKTPEGPKPRLSGQKTNGHRAHALPKIKIQRFTSNVIARPDPRVSSSS